MLIVNCDGSLKNNISYILNGAKNLMYFILQLHILRPFLEVFEENYFSSLKSKKSYKPKKYVYI